MVLEAMWDIYRRFFLPFGLLLTDMEAAGMAVDRWGGRGPAGWPAKLQLE